MKLRHLLAAIFALILAVTCFWFLTVRIYQFTFSEAYFTESAREIESPDRGFYFQNGYVIQDEPQDFMAKISQWNGETPMRLEMLQINLRNFRDTELTQTALDNIDCLLRAYSGRNSRLIVRILYDWSGKAKEYEPKSLDIILRHMQQIGPKLLKYKDMIYTTQGLFIGNWGEMNGTPFVDQESVKQLANEFLKSTNYEIFLSVRMPMFWRRITELSDPGDSTARNNQTACRIGLYNDGMLGNESDWGTYGVGESRKANPLTYWNREEELEFQDALCSYVPNGGEVIADNPYNDFENARQDLATMHVSYLNRDYDRKVLDKWASSVVSEGSCFDGMDGLSYIQRHLGYRYLLDGSYVQYDFLKNKICMTAKIRNVGFAPVYSQKPMAITLCSEDEVIVLTPEGDLRQAVGGNQSAEILNVCAAVPVSALKQTSYQAYIQIWDPVMNAQLELANEQMAGEYGYYLGEFSFERLPWYHYLFNSAQ